jgi:phosphoribosylamine--glycine ligase
MKVFIIGNGGRESALRWKILQNPAVQVCYDTRIDQKEDLLQFALSENVDLTIVGPEGPLNDGIVDTFKQHGLLIFGPSREAARLESSKIYAKKFMKKYGIKTASFKEFESISDAKKYIQYCTFPVVIKADGLANGKGVVICGTIEEATKTLEDMMVRKTFGKAGEMVIVEDFLSGFEVSMLCITDGVTIKPFISSMDYKKIGNHDQGLNTGGMGAIAPNPYFSKKLLEIFEKQIMYPTLSGIKNERLDFHGVLYFGLIVHHDEISVLEYNVRLGDPESQAILPLMRSDFLGLVLATLKEDLVNTSIEWYDKHSCCVVASSSGYPLTYQKDKKISGLEKIRNNLFLSGVTYKNGEYYTNGGRVFSINAIADTLESAREKCYQDLTKVDFDGIYYRKDIGTIKEVG